MTMGYTVFFLVAYHFSTTSSCSSVTPMMTRPLDSSFSKREAKVGISALQGPHQVRKTWIRTALPFRSSRVSGAVLYHLSGLNSGAAFSDTASAPPDIARTKLTPTAAIIEDSFCTWTL